MSDPRWGKQLRVTLHLGISFAALVSVKPGGA
jgi:hypothetical protein